MNRGRQAMLNRRRLAVLAAVALLVAVPAVAYAALTRVSDAQNDSATTLDIEAVTVDTTGDGMLRHLITAYGSFKASDLLATSGPPPALCVLIWTKRTPGDERPDYELCAHATSDGRKLRGTLVRLPQTGLPRRVRIVEADRPDERSVALEITKRDLGSPKSYRFTAIAQGAIGPSGPTGATCDRFVGCVDFAPERGSYKTFKP